MVSDDKVISRRAEESAAAGSSPGGLNDPLLQSDLEEVRKVSLQALTSASPTIKGAAEGLVRAGGKMLRPAMVVLAGRYGKSGGGKDSFPGGGGGDASQRHPGP